MDNSEIFKETEFPIICTYCRVWLNGPESWTCGQEACNLSCASHSICPDCLLENLPQEYIKIQKERRLRIKNIYKKSYPTLIGKLDK
jgi:hypothetical protein